MGTVAVSPEVLEWARVRSGIDAEELLRAFPKLPLWKTREQQPTLREVEALARRTHTPLGYFFLDTPPEETLPAADFRTLKDRPLERASAELIDTVYAMDLRQGWVRDFLIEEGAEPLPFFGSCRLEDEPGTVARRIRETLGLGTAWAEAFPTFVEALRHLRLQAESAGIFVVVNGVVGNNTHRKLDPDEFRGFVLPDPYAPFVFVNGADYKGAQIFTLAHELAHVWLGLGAIFNLEKLRPANDAGERFCNEVAAELLVPRRELSRVWREVVAAGRFEALARRFKTSPIVVARRALDLRLIARDEYFEFYDRYSRRERQKVRTSGGDFYVNQDSRVGRRFGWAVGVAAREGRLLYRQAYRLTGLYGATFEKYLEKIGVGP